MGLERIAAILQNAETNFESDLFVPLIEFISDHTKASYESNTKINTAYKIIVDHARTLTFAIADGAYPSNEGRGYVLRRLLRRAVKNQSYIDIHKPFLHLLVPVIIKQYAEYYPELVANEGKITKVIHAEEVKFLETLEDGLRHFNNIIESKERTKHIMQNNRLSKFGFIGRKASQILSRFDVRQVSGEEAFKLYDTYGFPLELIEECATERNYGLDKVGFEAHLLLQKERARRKQKASSTMNKQNKLLLNFDETSEFVGYETNLITSRVILLFKDTQKLKELTSGQAHVILDRTPFYAESGGQTFDTGFIGEHKVIEVQKAPHGQFIHTIEVNGVITEDTVYEVGIDVSRRTAIAKNHSATHLLHKALKNVLGTDVNQAGSMQDDEKIRFDFNFNRALSDDELSLIQANVNHDIKADELVTINEMALNEAKAIGAMALFGEKYLDIVRVVAIGNSIELCGGTHVEHTAEIENFYILSETGIGSGIRRIEAISGDRIKEYGKMLETNLNSAIDNNQLKTIISELAKITKIKSVYDISNSLISAAQAKIVELESLKSNELVQNQNNLQTITDHLITTTVLIKEVN